MSAISFTIRIIILSSLLPSGHGFFKKHKGELEVRLGILAPLLIDLERNNAITALEREDVQSKSTRQEKNHFELDLK